MSDNLTKTALLSTSLRLLCTDFDGTLAEPEGRPILPLFFERLAAWRKRGALYWVVNTGRTFESLAEELKRRQVPIWPDWVVAIEREIWLVRDRRGVGWFEWNRKCELMHNQLWGSVKPLWRLIEDFITRHTKAQLAQDVGSPMGIIASCEEEAEEISAFLEPLLKDWPLLAVVRNSVYFRFCQQGRVPGGDRPRHGRAAAADYGRRRPSQRPAHARPALRASPRLPGQRGRRGEEARDHPGRPRLLHQRGRRSGRGVGPVLPAERHQPVLRALALFCSGGL
ncbi:MAG: hypothetical protein WDO13_11455 [Verrucomicrobiota bacterium]